jgi:hypothetical protein
MFAIADPCAPSLLLTDSCERLQRLDSVSVLGASTGVSARHERLSRHAGFDRWQHALDSLVRELNRVRAAKRQQDSRS